MVWKLRDSLNYIQADRYKETQYKDEKARLTESEGVYSLDTDCKQPASISDTNCTQPASILDTQVRLGKDRLGEEKEEASQATRDDKKTVEEIPEEAIRLASLLLSRHQDFIDSGFKASPAQVHAWAKDIEKLNRIDGRDWPDIEAVITWVKTPGQFWAPNIMSGRKLREKYPTLVGQMKRPPGPVPKIVQRSTFLEMGA
jgi:hypothetical protein